MQQKNIWILTDHLRLKDIVNDLREVKIKNRYHFVFPTPETYVLICMLLKTLFWILTSYERSEVIVYDLQEFKLKNWCYFLFPHPQKN